MLSNGILRAPGEKVSCVNVKTTNVSIVLLVLSHEKCLMQTCLNVSRSERAR